MKNMRRFDRKSVPKCDKLSVNPLKNINVSIVSVNEWSNNGWTAGDGFSNELNPRSSGQMSNESYSSNSSRNDQKHDRNRMATKIGNNKCKTQPKRSRYARDLSPIFKTDSNDNRVDNQELNKHLDIDVDNNTNDDRLTSPMMDIIVTDCSSPLKDNTPQISDFSSPIRSQSYRQIERKESTNQTIHRSIINHLDDTVDKLRKQSAEGRNQLTTRAMKLMQNIQQSRLKFCQRDSLLNQNKSKPLVLRVIQIDTRFGISYLKSIVIIDPNKQFSHQMKVLLVLNHKIIDGIDVTSHYTIELFSGWNQLEVNDQTFIVNAFNIKFIEDKHSFDEPNNNWESDYSIIWQKEKP